MLKITNDFDEINQEENAVVCFTATCCRPCKALKPQYGKVAVSDPETSYYMVDVDQIDSSIMDKYNIRSVPQIFILNKGEFVKPVLGRTSQDILEEMGK